ncbi:hypothetical protein [Natronosalvus halobius]|uniref:hypothetical protein n=1 Tax=Natronosalvus halobius TaxID=2953746 RepID=UPI0020A05E20|nr:hypothetical protein [Natronosalvus halobius]USZ73012.1 hypothetical protein NGM15_06840 [Natronosalvus halobius]
MMPHYPHTERVHVASVPRLVVSLAVLVGFVGFLVVLSYPVPVLAAIGGAVAALVIARLVRTARSLETIRLPGTKRHLRLRPARN